MADLIALLQPRITDKESFQQFAENLEDLVPVIEKDIATLRRTPDDKDVLARLFRSLHNIKGDAAMCRVDVGVAICQPVEDLLAHCRDGSLRLTSLLSELLLLALDRLELVIEALGQGRDFSHLNLLQLVGGLEAVAAASTPQVPTRAADAIEAVTGFRPIASSHEPTTQTAAPPVLSQATDLQFFRTIAQALESRSALFQGRTDRILQLARETNRAAGSPVDSAQLDAAVFLHDIGMMFVTESTWLKPGNLTAADRDLLHEHPGYAAGMLQRMPGWSAAAEIVMQHHEKADGSGYPVGLKADQICPGAKILAIVDAFESVTLKHSDRGHNRSLVRAIAEINACDTQFAKEWIEPFNKVIRSMIES